MSEEVKEKVKIIADNRKAWHEYFIEETFETGIALVGSEVKSMRAGQVSLRDSYADILNGEIFLYNMHISPYDKAHQFNHEPKRTRKLLLHKQEIRKLSGHTTQKGLTLVPLRLYFKRGKVKVELALAKGKKLYDKRDDLAKRDAERDIARALRGRNKED